MDEGGLKRRIGGREVYPVGLGCWAIGGVTDRIDAAGERIPFGWGPVDDRESIRAIRRALDLGVELFDTANNYGAGHSERILGEALGARRTDVVLVTKFGSSFDEEARTFIADGAFSTDLAELRRLCEASLRRLRTDHIDVYLFHRGEHPIEDAPVVRENLEVLVREGKIGGYGWSTDDPARARAFAAGEHCVAIEFRINMLWDAPEMLRVLAEHDVAGLVKQPLNSGVLSGRMRPDTVFTSDDGRYGTSFAVGRGAWRLRQIERIRPIVTGDGRTMAQAALGWILGRDPRLIPIPGFKTTAQVEDLAGAARFPALTEAQMAAVRDAIAAEGPAPD